jgi:hypothetical protein
MMGTRATLKAADCVIGVIAIGLSVELVRRVQSARGVTPFFQPAFFFFASNAGFAFAGPLTILARKLFRRRLPLGFGDIVWLLVGLSWAAALCESLCTFLFWPDRAQDSLGIIGSGFLAGSACLLIPLAFINVAQDYAQPDQASGLFRNRLGLFVFCHYCIASVFLLGTVFLAGAG